MSAIYFPAEEHGDFRKKKIVIQNINKLIAIHNGIVFIHDIQINVKSDCQIAKCHVESFQFVRDGPLINISQLSQSLCVKIINLNFVSTDECTIFVSYSASNFVIFFFNYF